MVTVLLRGGIGMSSQVPGMSRWLARGQGWRCLYSRLYYQFPPLYSYWLHHLDADLVLV